MTELQQPAPASAPARGLDRHGSARAGLAYGLGAYLIWGFISLYFHALGAVPPLIILCHRILWSALVLTLVVSFRREWPALWPVVRSGRNLLLLSAGAVLIGTNWLLYIYAVSTHQLLQASLGYFINPLVSIALGLLCLQERLRRFQGLAVGLALLAVLNLALRSTTFPWLAVGLAGSFGSYGLVRKKVDVNALHALLIESVLLVPVALVLLAVLPANKLSAATWGTLSLAGPITVTPLLCYGAALRRLKLSTVGFLLYLNPTLQFLVALYWFGEPLDRVKLGSFGLCWAAVALYLADSLLNRQPQLVPGEME